MKWIIVLFFLVSQTLFADMKTVTKIELVLNQSVNIDKNIKESQPHGRLIFLVTEGLVEINSQQLIKNDWIDYLKSQKYVIKSLSNKSQIEIKEYSK